MIQAKMSYYFDWDYVFYVLPAIGGFVLLWGLVTCCYRLYRSHGQRPSNQHSLRGPVCPPQYRCDVLNTAVREGIITRDDPLFNHSWRQGGNDQVDQRNKSYVHGVGHQCYPPAYPMFHGQVSRSICGCL